MAFETPQRPTEARVDLDALAFNFHSSKQFIGTDVGYMAVVKANGYGHGAAACSLRLEAEGVDWFGVALPEEGVEIRKAGVTRPILCLGSFWTGQEKLLVEYNLTPVVYDLDVARNLHAYVSEHDLTIDIHVKIDTGMHRVGVDHDQVAAFAEALKHLTNLKVKGLLTHFASADDPADDDFTKAQILRFEKACDQFRAAGHAPEWIDLANSPGAIRFRNSRGNLVRLGGALYGLLHDILKTETDRPEMQRVLSLHSRIAHLRHLRLGQSLGYGRTFVTKRDSVIALVPIGYADGYPRGLSNCGKVSINGNIVPVVGRISMDWTLIDVTDIPNAAVDDEVLLIGENNGASISAADIAEEIGSIGYEITCGISSRVPRVFEEKL